MRMIAELTALLEEGRNPILDLDLIDEVVYLTGVKKSIPKAGHSLRFSMLGGTSLQKSYRGGGS